LGEPREPLYVYENAGRKFFFEKWEWLPADCSFQLRPLLSGERLSRRDALLFGTVMRAAEARTDGVLDLVGLIHDAAADASRWLSRILLATGGSSRHGRNHPCDGPPRCRTQAAPLLAPFEEQVLARLEIRKLSLSASSYPT